jgi:hypothetical protein
VKSVAPGLTDSNTGSSASFAFQRTTQAGTAYNNPAIVYSPPLPNGGVNPIITATAPPAGGGGVPGNADFYFDYLIRVPSNAAPNLGYSVYVVYTAVLQ